MVCGFMYQVCSYAYRVRRPPSGTTTVAEGSALRGAPNSSGWGLWEHTGKLLIVGVALRDTKYCLAVRSLERRRTHTCKPYQ